METLAHAIETGMRTLAHSLQSNDLRTLHATIAYECTQTIHQFFRHLDHAEFVELAKLFTPEGVWFRMGKANVGAEAILSALAGRPTNLTTRHNVSNVLIDISKTSVEAKYYVSVFDHEGPTSEGPAPLMPASLILDCKDRLSHDGARWLFESRVAKPIFKRA